LEKYIQSMEGKLSNAQFVEKAPAEVVVAEKAKLLEAKEKTSRVRKNLEFLKS
jgi:valyl-tRNA synthetase